MCICHLTLVGENALKSIQPITSIWGFNNISHIQHGVLIVPNPQPQAWKIKQHKLRVYLNPMIWAQHYN